MDKLIITRPKTDRAASLVQQHGSVYGLEGSIAGVHMIHALAEEDKWFGWINGKEAEFEIERESEV